MFTAFQPSGYQNNAYQIVPANGNNKPSGGGIVRRRHYDPNQRHVDLDQLQRYDRDRRQQREDKARARQAAQARREAAEAQSAAARQDMHALLDRQQQEALAAAETALAQQQVNETARLLKIKHKMEDEAILLAILASQQL